MTIDMSKVKEVKVALAGGSMCRRCDVCNDGEELTLQFEDLDDLEHFQSEIAGTAEIFRDMLRGIYD